MSDDEGGGRKRMVRLPTAGQESGRGKPARLKSAKRHTPSSQAWLERQINDPYAAKARSKGYRSRAAFKLTEIDDRFHLLTRGSRVLDLGCAPGGWIQVMQEKGVAAIVGIDLLPVDSLAPAQLVQGDFTDPGQGEALIELLGGAPDLVLSDMAPNTMGHRQTDHLRIIGLVEAAADFAIQTLRPGGAFVSKAFQGGETAGVLKLLRAHFAAVRHVKPKASRSDSAEVYLVATGFKRPA